MKGKLWKIIVASLAVSVTITCAVVFSPASENMETKVEGSNMFGLIKPPFVSAAEEGTNFLEEEAGISAYTNVGEAIDLDDAKSVFRTIESETEDYLIGSVPLPDYAETEDVHCYVHRDGWVVAYYVEEEPAAKVLDWNSYLGAAITSTKLENGLAVVCDAAGVPFIQAKYYHFQYPNAGNLLIAADALFEEGTDSFNLKIPNAFVIYERSYSHCSKGDGKYSKMLVDEEEISTVDAGDTHYGLLLPTQLVPDVSHVIQVTAVTGYWGDHSYPAFAAIALIYREA